jgi:NitT/TauT family transport system substrate-binding protein
MKRVRDFLFTHGLLGDNAKNADVIGVKFPDGAVLGNAKKIGLRFVTTYMDSAAAAKN